MNKPYIYVSIILISTLIITGCSTTSSGKGNSFRYERLATNSGFEEKTIPFENFSLKTYQKFLDPNDILHVYIEGDGNAWINKSTLSNDPTPLNPVALKLALKDRAKNILYIARPGQFQDRDFSIPNSSYWAGKRFSREVVDAIDQIIDLAKKNTQISDVEITGFSGGGALAILVSADREDVVAIRTVAGNLNTKEFTKYHNVSPLTGSLNPIDHASKVAHIPQKHFIGSRDKIMPDFIAESFADMIGDTTHSSIYILQDATHIGSWEQNWLDLLSVPLYTQPHFNLALSFKFDNLKFYLE